MGSSTLPSYKNSVWQHPYDVANSCLIHTHTYSSARIGMNKSTCVSLCLFGTYVLEMLCLEFAHAMPRRTH